MFGYRSLRSILVAGTALTALTAAIPTAALAQAAPNTGTAQANGPQSSSEGSIVVTGTRVVRNGYRAPTPLTVLTHEDIQNGSPTNNLADFVNEVPSLAGSTRPANSRLNLSSGQAGINSLNLRNLDSGSGTRTLVLIDGRRSVPSTINGVVDINTIPQALVDRVEIVTGGASAAYGSDAVAGVVNFVVNKKFEGIKLTADTGVTSRNDGFSYSLGLAAGLSFAGGAVILGATLVNAWWQNREPNLRSAPG